ncbi:hypothetical protein ACLMJK_002182 [Lecanora helva]
MAESGSAPMELSMGEESLISHVATAFGLREESATQSTLRPSDIRNFTYLKPSGLHPWQQNIKSLHRSSVGEIYSYKEMRQIGSGGFGNCFLLKRNKDQALRVCKVQARDFHYGEDYNKPPLEVDILRDLLPRHDRILHLHEFVIQPLTVQLYYDYYEGGDLKQLITRYYDRWEDIPETFLWHAYLQLSEAIAFLHYGYDRRQQTFSPADWTTVIHGDIKDKNIFLGPPDPHSSDPLAREYPSLVLGDFGMADTQPSDRYGTTQWQPPELPITSVEADVWSVGAVIHALAHEGKPPLAPLPLGFLWEDWCIDPGAREPMPLYGLYSDALHNCVFSALEHYPEARCNSYDLHLMVLQEWCLSIGPKCDVITPLLPAMAEKLYNENGATTTGGSDSKLPKTGTDSITRLTPKVVAGKRRHSATSEHDEVLTSPSWQAVVKKVRMDFGFEGEDQSFSRTEAQRISLADVGRCSFHQTAETFSCNALPAALNEIDLFNLATPTEGIMADVELQAVAAVIRSEGMTCTGETISKRVNNSCNGYSMKLDTDPYDWFINPRNTMYIFGTANSIG